MGVLLFLNSAQDKAKLIAKDMSGFTVFFLAVFCNLIYVFSVLPVLLINSSASLHLTTVSIVE